MCGMSGSVVGAMEVGAGREFCQAGREDCLLGLLRSSTFYNCPCVSWRSWKPPHRVIAPPSCCNGGRWWWAGPGGGGGLGQMPSAPCVPAGPPHLSLQPSRTVPGLPASKSSLSPSAVCCFLFSSLFQTTSPPLGPTQSLPVPCADLAPGPVIPESSLVARD